VRQQQSVGVTGGVGEHAVVATLRDPAVDEELVPAHLDPRHGAGDLPHGAEETELAVGQGMRFGMRDNERALAHG
jgi:hypothetical protein